MLKATLDFLDVPNDNGLTEQKQIFETLEAKVKQLVSHLKETASP